MSTSALSTVSTPAQLSHQSSYITSAPAQCCVMPANTNCLATPPQTISTPSNPSAPAIFHASAPPVIFHTSTISSCIYASASTNLQPRPCAILSCGTSTGTSTNNLGPLQSLSTKSTSRWMHWYVSAALTVSEAEPFPNTCTCTIGLIRWPVLSQRQTRGHQRRQPQYHHHHRGQSAIPATEDVDWAASATALRDSDEVGRAASAVAATNDGDFHLTYAPPPRY